VRQLIQFVAAFGLSLLLYGLVFTLVHRPLTLGDIAPLIQSKSQHAQGLPAPRLLLLAGSNGRYSHRCLPLQQATGRACSNLSIAVGIGLDFQLRQFEPLLRPGDVLYLPLEYSQYHVSRDEMAAGADNAVLVHDLREQLWELPPQRLARALGHFDLQFLVHGLVEMALARTGFQRRATSTALTPEGDQRGHTAAASLPYRDALRRTAFDTRPLPLQSHALQLLDSFLARAAQRGVRVVGGLPTVPEGVPLDLAGIERLRRLYLSHGHAWLELPKRSQYPLDCFHDTLYHLNEECQVAHSQALGAQLSLLLGPPPARSPP